MIVHGIRNARPSKRGPQFPSRRAWLAHELEQKKRYRDRVEDEVRYLERELKKERAGVDGR